MAENYYPIDFDEMGQFIVINNGTAPAPCVITFVPMVNFSRVVFTGLSEEPIEIENIGQDQILVIDGEQRKVTLDGQDYMQYYDSWEFPKLQPGVNELSVNNSHLCQLAVEYSLRYI